MLLSPVLETPHPAQRNVFPAVGTHDPADQLINKPFNEVGQVCWGKGKPQTVLSRGFLELELRTHVLFKEQNTMGYVLIGKHSMGWCDAQPGVFRSLYCMNNTLLLTNNQFDNSG